MPLGPGKYEEHLETLRHAFAELYNCVQVGPHWFTRGEWGQLAHARTWTDRGLAAIKVLEEMHRADRSR